MAAISPGTSMSPHRKARKQTQRANSHRYESFSKRIAKLKIDPVHNVSQSRRQDVGENIFESHFRTALDEFSEINLTKTFTSFLNRVLPLSESLPQLLHHADQIVSLLLEHIQKEDSLALEPLLSLTAHLAHDLGQEFEKYFIQIVKTVAEISTTQDDPTIVEACFTCLAWMFKFLSRLLISDLKPLLNVVLPYFSVRKEYIRRFAAESTAFLVRKAAIVHPKNPNHIQNAIEHIFRFSQSVSNHDDRNRFNLSVTTLLAESAAGVDASLHSSVIVLYRSLDQLIVTSTEASAMVEFVLEALTVDLVHRCDASGFRPLLELIVNFVIDPDRSIQQKKLGLKLLFTAICTRGGSRVYDWKIISQALQQYLDSSLSTLEGGCTSARLIAKTMAAYVHHATLDQLLPFLPKLFQDLTNLVSPAEVFTFCETIARLSKTKFQDLILPHLQQYIVPKWANNESAVVVLLNDLHQLECIERRAGKTGYMTIPASVDEALNEKLGKSPSNDSGRKDVHSLLLSRSIHFPKSAESTVEFQRALQKGFELALSDVQQQQSLENRVRLGWGFQMLVQLSEDVTTISSELYAKIKTLQKETFQSVPFLEAFAKCAASVPPQFPDTASQQMVYIRLRENLLCTSVDVRKASVTLLQALSRPMISSWLRETCGLFQEILNTQYSISNARKLAMLIRKLPYAHRDAPADTDLSRLVPHFALGLLSEYHDQLRKDVAASLGQMVTNTSTEQQVLDVVREWLHAPIEQFLAKGSHADSTLEPKSSFQWSQLDATNEAFETSSLQFVNPEKVIEDWVSEAHNLRSSQTPQACRLIALQVLVEISDLAERRSKSIVPAFLASQRGRRFPAICNSDESQSTNTLSPDIEESGWISKERKLFLQLLGQFNNPRSLYRANDVYNVLLNLLSNGDPETRKLALLALTKWKNQALNAVKEDLLKIAEDKNTTVELGLMLSLDDEFSAIEADHRPEILPVLLRLVFGQLIGRAGVHGSQEAKRKTILRLLFRMDSKDVHTFLDIVLGPFAATTTSNIQTIMDCPLGNETLNLDQQYGFLRMIISMLEILEVQFKPYGEKVIRAVLQCTVRASRQINHLDNMESAPAMLRNIRRTGIQCLNLLFEYCESLSISNLIDVIYEDLISPRISNFVVENLQSVSGLLRMFSVWVRSVERVQILQTKDERILGRCWELLASEKTKSAVKLFVLENIVLPVSQTQADSDPETHDHSTECLKKEAPAILDSISSLLKQTPPKELLLVATNIVQSVSAHVESQTLRERVVELMIDILNEPHQRLPPHIKGQILKAIESTAEHVSIGRYYEEKFFENLSSMFDYFHDTPNRQTCARILEQIARYNSFLSEIVSICKSLNSQALTSLDDVDREQQSIAFVKIHDMLSQTQVQLFRPLLPILYNLISLVRWSDETAVRGNALSCLKHLAVVLAQKDLDTSLLRKILLDAIKKHVKHDSELVRADFVEILGTTVQHWDSEPQLDGMKVLLVGNDEEASFFTNILHIQHHRRTRAIRRLMMIIETGVISTSSVSDFFLPLLQKFVCETGTSDSAQATKGQAIASMTTLLQWLDWKTFRTVFRQYRQFLDNKSEDNGADVRLLSHSADALGNAISMQSAITEGNTTLPHLTLSLPQQEIIEQELRTNFIPKLAEFSHHKDEGELSQRIPAAVVAIKLINLLPENEKSFQATPFVLDIAQLLRSRVQQTRDLARNKLAEIVALLGASSMQFVLSQLRTVLMRGYQRHVLSYTVHTILLVTADQRRVGDLDYCLEDLVKVLLEDIFGLVGQEKDDQNYISSMKEVKSNKSFDSIEILAKSTSAKHLSKLVVPFESLLSGPLSSTQIRRIDEVFRRIGVGISHSSVASNQQLLVFAFELVQSFYKVKPTISVVPMTNEERNRDRFIVQTDNTEKVGTVKNSSLMYKIAKFSIDIVRSTFVRHTELMTAENVHGFLPIVGDLLVEGQEDVKISAMRLLSIVIKLQMPAFEDGAKLYVIEAVKVVKSAVSTNDEAAQAALKMVAAIIREKPEVELRESDVAYLLKRLTPDLEEPDRQGVTFTFVKAVMARRMQIPEVYEIADKLGYMMVVSQSRNSRDAARGVYVHFLLDYPQAKSRWSKQVKFLVKNLEYQHPEGRQSIMEALGVLMSKLDKNTKQELASVVFIPVVLRVASDENENCRDMATALLSQLFEKTSSETQSGMLKTLHAWIEQGHNRMLTKIAMQTFSIYITSLKRTAEVEFALLRDHILSILRLSGQEDGVIEVQYQALELMASLAKVYPEEILTAKQDELWGRVIEIMGTPQAQLQNSASKLIALFFQDCIDKRTTPLPLTSSYGLAIGTDTMIKLLQTSLRILKHQHIDQQLAEIVLQNTLFLGHCLNSNNAMMPLRNKGEDRTTDDDNGNDYNESSSDEDEEGFDNAHPSKNNGATISIPVVQYMIDQATRNIRREPTKQHSAILRSKIRFVELVKHLVSHLPGIILREHRSSIVQLLVPLIHLTSTTTSIPRSSDHSYAAVYQSLIEQSQVCLDEIQTTLGDQDYMNYVTAAARLARERRSERRGKRALDTVADPERAAKEKRRKFERKKERRKEVKGIHRGRRRKDLGF